MSIRSNPNWSGDHFRLPKVVPRTDIWSCWDQLWQDGTRHFWVERFSHDRTYFAPLRIRACAVLHLHVLRALIEHSKVTKSASGKGRQPSCGDCAEPPPPSLPVSVTVKTVPNLLPPGLPETTLCVVMRLSMAYSTWADVGEHRGICCQNLTQWVGT